MADTTPTYDLPFLELADAPDLASATEDLALAVEDELARIDSAVATINGLTVAVGSNTNSEGPYSSTTFAAGTEVCSCPFTASASGAVVVFLKAYFQAGITDKIAVVSTEVRTGASIGGGSVVASANGNDALTIGGTVTTGVECKLSSSTPRLITGLTPGNSYHVRAMHQSEASGNITIFNRQIIVVPML